MATDRIIIKDLRCSVGVGVHQIEHEVKRNCSIDVIVFYDLTNAGRDDDLDETVNYGKIIALIQKLSGEADFKLLEAFAYKIFEEIFNSTTAKKVRLRVKKLNPPVEGQLRYAGIDLTRERKDFIRRLSQRGTRNQK